MMGDRRDRLELGTGHELKVNHKGKLILQHNRNGYPLNREIDPEALKKWLEEATKPRFYINQDGQSFEIRDNRDDIYKVVALFYETNGFDAKAEAERLCKQLNEGD
jgi:hypothetical protein